MKKQTLNYNPQLSKKTRKSLHIAFFFATIFDCMRIKRKNK